MQPPILPPPSQSCAPLDPPVQDTQRDGDALPTTLILTPVRTAIEKNGTVWTLPGGVVDTVRGRPVLTLTCYPTVVTSKTAVGGTAVEATAVESQQQPVAQANNNNNGPICKIIGQINDASPKLTLGRNDTTLITDSDISRNVCTIICNYDEPSTTFEFRLIAMKPGMVSLNGRRPVGAPPDANHTHRTGTARHKPATNGGATNAGQILNTGDLVSLHDKERDRRYPYRVDIMVPQRVGQPDDGGNGPPTGVRVKEDRGLPVLGTAVVEETAVPTLQPNRPDINRDDLALYDDLPSLPPVDDGPDDGPDLSSQTSSSTTSSTVPTTADDRETKEAPRIKEDPAVMKYSTLKENLYDAYSSTRKRKNQLAAERAAATNNTESTSSSSSATLKPPPLTIEQINQQIREQQLVKQQKLQEEQRAQDIQRLKTTAQQHVLHELSCSICMEILVKTHVAHPCGHLFCGPCMERMSTFSIEADGPSNPLFLAFQNPPNIKLTSCPTCRVPMTNCTLARSYDNVIWNMILMGTIFCGSDAEDDLKQFLLRSGRNIGELTPIERDCIFGRNRSLQGLTDDGGGNNNDDCHIVKRVRTNPTWLQPYVGRIVHQEVNGILDLTEPLVFDVSQGTNMDDPICL